MPSLETGMALAAGAVAVPLALAVWLAMRRGGALVGPALGLFVFGATFGAAAVLALTSTSGARDSALATLAFVPLVEETVKGAGLLLVRPRMVSPAAGAVVGLALGLGYGATESFLYAMRAADTLGVDAAWQTIAVRNVSSVLMHGASSGLLGLAVAFALPRRRASLAAVGLAVAIGLHAVYNGIVDAPRWGLPTAIGLVAIALGLLQWLSRTPSAKPAPPTNRAPPIL